MTFSIVEPREGRCCLFGDDGGGSVSEEVLDWQRRGVGSAIKTKRDDG